MTDTFNDRLDDLIWGEALVKFWRVTQAELSQVQP